MDPQRWAKVESLYHAALAKGSSERSDYLAAACAGDAELRREVESLLNCANAELASPVADDKPWPPGFRLGAYEIVAQLGAGGMGEVYRARDTKLRREVAIKVLPREFQRDPARLARFEREAHVLASLNHPNIAHIYGVEDGALIMELVEGQSPKGPMPCEEAWKIAIQIADALAYAHEKGVMHRDLKPANVIVTPEGLVKLLDFGLAKAFSAQPDSIGSDPENSPTVTLGGTVTGVILGTAAYMAPEQAKGKGVDKRADIWSWGVVLYELLTGERIFQADDVADTIAQVLTKEPDLARVPVQVRKLLQRCLEKDPKQRLRDIADARDLLVAPAPLPAASGSRVGMAGWITAAVLLVALGIPSFFHFREVPAPRSVLRYTIAAPADAADISGLSISPDGRYLVISADVNGKRELWLRALNALDAHPIPGTDGADYPFWSPDSRYIGFFAEGRLKKVAASGGLPEVLCEANIGRGGSWNRDDVIIFGSSAGGAIKRVSAAGGMPVEATRREGISRFPVFLPDGRHFLYQATGLSGQRNGTYLGSIDGSESRRVLTDESSVVFGSGRLLFIRDGALMVERIDMTSMQPAGEAVPIVNNLPIDATNEYAPITVSQNGMLLYLAGGLARSRTQFAWFDRGGKRFGTAGAPGRDLFPAVSPDGNSVLFQRPGSTGADLWLWDLKRGFEQRLTADPSVNQMPIWSPSGDRAVFASNRGGGVFNLYELAVNSTGKEELLYADERNKAPSQWSRDGQFLVYSASVLSTTGGDIWVLPMKGGRGQKPFIFVHSDVNAVNGQISPDSHWMAYASRESGREIAVYVRPFPVGEGQWRISIGRGAQPRWSGDGKELFFLASGGRIMAAKVVKAEPGANPIFEFSEPEQLFVAPVVPGLAPNLHEYDVTADGKRFLIATTISPESKGPAPLLDMVVNWDAELTK